MGTDSHLSDNKEFPSDHIQGVQFATLGDTMWVLLIDGTFMLDYTGNILSDEDANAPYRAIHPEMLKKRSQGLPRGLCALKMFEKCFGASPKGPPTTAKE